MHDDLARIRDRQRGISLLLASGLTTAALELQATSFAEIAAAGEELLRVAEGAETRKAAKLAGARLERLRPLAESLRGDLAVGWDEMLDVSDFTLESLEELLADLRRGVLRTTSVRIRGVMYVFSAFLTVVVLAVGMLWGPQSYGKWKDHVNEGRVRTTQGVLTEMASLALNAKKASEKTLLQLTGETCTECDCKNSKNLHVLYQFDGCSLRWEKAITAIYKAATGREDVPERFLRDPWGAPFALNENEGEVKGECTPDVIRTAGPDGILNTADDIGVAVPTAFCQPVNP
jgi:hypothetical protein